VITYQFHYENLLDTLGEYHGDFDTYTTLILTLQSSFLKTWTFRESKHPSESAIRGVRMSPIQQTPC